jgi:hypothetical protein
MSGYIGSKTSVTQVDGYNRTEADAKFMVGTVGTSLPSPVPTAGSQFYNTTTKVFYISSGTTWNVVSDGPPDTTGGTVTISALVEGATFSYNLGIDFSDAIDSDAALTYTLSAGTMPSGCTLPTAGNTAFTGTAVGVSSNTNYTWTIRATDTSGNTATQNYQQTITHVDITVTGGTVTISALLEGSAASYDVDSNFTFAAGAVFSAYSLQSGSLPSGLSLNTSTGVISGTMGLVSNTTAYSFTIRATDTDGDTADQAYSWTITDTPFGATGGTITTSGGYKYHKFTSSVSGASGFVPNKSGSVDYLIVAGGGAGGGYDAGGYENGGGGGAGGLLQTSVSVSAQQYSIVVGAGGPTAKGSNSSALGVTSLGGGLGKDLRRETSIHDGGSGGGAVAWGSGVSQQGGSGTSGQGNNGGNSQLVAASGGGGGGGGAGSAGSAGSNGTGGNGGAGSSYSTWATATSSGDSGYYAGGGGGASPSTNGSGGAGGGGNAADTTPQNGATNTGGGGGGGATDGYYGSGGSGIVIIRYAV